MTDSAAKKKTPNKMMLIGIALLLGAVGAFMFTRKAGTSDPEGKGGKKKHQKVEKSELGPKVDLGEFTVNLSGGATHYLRANVTVELEAGSSEEKSKEEVPIIKDAVVLTLSHKGFDDLQAATGIQKLKKELKEAINKALGAEEDEEPVTEVYFTSFVTQ
ncbi:MAG: flagellar basal body-associated FliL family protein [Armatimonadetes bacterium]|nr:flagellar basal body-associated FliL family protein [Armatimonadota bacterium]